MDESPRPMLPTAALDYELPPELIATEPAQPRDAARLMVVSRQTGHIVAHEVFRNIGAWLKPGDLLVVNATRVIPARFRGVRADTGGAAEGLFIEELPPNASREHAHWRVMLKMKRARPGVCMNLFTREGQPSRIAFNLIERAADEGWIVRVHDFASPLTRCNSRAVLDRVGLTPLPPYILAARKSRDSTFSDDADRAEYQTVYACDAQHSDHLPDRDASCAAPPHNSVAAPTAGLHFTPELMTSLRAAGINFAEVMLDVGLGTFKPVETEFVQQHPMHSEFCWVPHEAAHAIADTKSRGGRILAVGTTAARTLESFNDLSDLTARGPTGLHTRLLITPGWTWRVVDGLITNFHLPRTTLLAMVAAAMEGTDDTIRISGSEEHHRAIERLLNAYREAVRERYRFYSFGDAMIVV